MKRVGVDCVKFHSHSLGEDSKCDLFIIFEAVSVVTNMGYLTVIVGLVDRLFAMIVPCDEGLWPEWIPISLCECVICAVSLLV